MFSFIIFHVYSMFLMIMFVRVQSVSRIRNLDTVIATSEIPDPEGLR